MDQWVKEYNNRPIKIIYIYDYYLFIFILFLFYSFFLFKLNLFSIYLFILYYNFLQVSISKKYMLIFFFEYISHIFFFLFKKDWYIFL